MAHGSTLAVVLTVTVVAIVALFFFNIHTQKKFGFRFFSIKVISALGVSSVLFFAGIAMLYQRSQQGEYFGLALMLAGGIILWWVLLQNFKKTNFVYGLVGTILQIFMFATLASSGLVIGMLVAGIMFVVLSAIQPVFVVNRKQPERS